MQAFTKCVYCGEPVLLEISSALRDDAAAPTNAIWICPYVGCARQNTLPGVVVHEVATAELATHVPTHRELGRGRTLSRVPIHAISPPN